MTVSRPMLRYHGGKWRLAPWIISQMPPHRIYVEPFGGGGSVLMRKPSAKTEIYNDLDGDVVRLFRVLRDPDQAAELARRLQLTPFARDDYEHWAYDEPADDIDAAHRLVSRSFMGQSSKGIWQRSGFDTRINPDGYCSRLSALRHAPEAVLEAATRLTAVIVEHDEALAVIRRHDRPDCLFYCDPPYYATNTTGIYTHEMTETGHEELAVALRDCRGMVMLSGYHSDLYDRLYADWYRTERDTLADTAKPRREVLWLNPAAASAQRQGRLIDGAGGRADA